MQDILVFGKIKSLTPYRFILPSPFAFLQKIWEFAVAKNGNYFPRIPFP